MVDSPIWPVNHPRPTMGRLDVAGPARSTIRHVCPECGGKFADNHGARIIVQICWACAGTGEVSDDDLLRVLRMSEARAEAGLG